MKHPGMLGVTLPGLIVVFALVLALAAGSSVVFSAEPVPPERAVAVTSVTNPGQIVRVSVSSDGTQGNAESGLPSISADGRFIAFYSEPTNLVSHNTNKASDIFVHDLWTRDTTRVSVASGGTQSNGPSWEPSISGDGRYIAFVSTANNLVSGDTNICSSYLLPGQCPDIFVHDRQTGQTIRASVASDGSQSDGDSAGVTISADGRYVAFHSFASNLVSGDTNNCPDVFVHDLKNSRDDSGVCC